MSLIDEAKLLLLEYGIDKCRVDNNDLKFCKHDKNDENYSYAYLYHHVMNGKLPGYLFVKLLQKINTLTSIAYLDHLSQNNEECFKSIGIAKKQYELGICYLNGENYTKAVQLFMLSNTPFAQYKLGQCYDYGKGVAKDAKKAVEYYIKSANQNNADALYELGYCYQFGNGVEINGEQSNKYYRLHLHSVITSNKN